MDSETPIIKYAAGAVGIILVCFCIGYFLLGPRTRNEVVQAPPVATPAPSPSPLTVAAGTPPVLSVDETTDEKEAERKKAEEAARKKAEEEARKKAEEDAKRLQAEAAAATLASPSPEPDAPATDATPVPDPGTAGNAEPSPAPPETLYRVRLDRTFDSRDEAEALARELSGRFGKPLIVPDSKGSKFHIQVGAFRDKSSAESRQQELKNNGYDASVQN